MSVTATPTHAREMLDLHAPFTKGIEADASIIEIRLALAEYRQRHGRDAWRIHLLPIGRA